MKRKSMIFCAIILMIVLTACGRNGGNPTPSNTASVISNEQPSFIPAANSEPSAQDPTESSKYIPSGPIKDRDAIAESASSQQARPPSYPSREEPSSQGPASEIPFEERTTMKMNLQIGNQNFTATLEKNASAEAFAALMKAAPLVMQMSDYAGFEKVGSLETSLPASNRQTTTQPGDIVLYNGNQIELFYGSNSWSYTRLGRIDDLTGWEEALGNGDVSVAFSVG